MYYPYSLTKCQKAIRDQARAMVDYRGNMPSVPGVFPNELAVTRSSPWKITEDLQPPPPRGTLKIVAAGKKKEP